MRTENYTREYLAYCKANGRKPVEQMDHDKKKFPGGRMCGFILWMSDKLSAFKLAHPEACIGRNIADHNAKCLYLEATA